MPYQQAYTPQSVGKGGSKTPANVMGNQGNPVTIKPMFNKSKPTKQIKFPQ